MSAVLEQEHSVFNEIFEHPSLMCHSVESNLLEKARSLLFNTPAFTYMLLEAEVPHNLHLVFYNQDREFHSHYIQVSENNCKNGQGRRWNKKEAELVWKNGSDKSFNRLKDLIPFSMGVTPGIETPYILN